MSNPQRFDTKIAVLLRDDLVSWQRLNVTAFLVSGIAGTQGEVIGKAYADADGIAYLPMFRQPVLVFAGDRGTLTIALSRAREGGLTPAIFTSDLFLTGNDEDNRAAVQAIPTDRLDLVGLAIYGSKNSVNKILKGAVLHA